MYSVKPPLSQKGRVLVREERQSFRGGTARRPAASTRSSAAIMQRNDLFEQEKMRHRWAETENAKDRRKVAGK